MDLACWIRLALLVRCPGLVDDFFRSPLSVSTRHAVRECWPAPTPPTRTYTHIPLTQCSLIQHCSFPCLQDIDWPPFRFFVPLSLTGDFCGVHGQLVRICLDADRETLPTLSLSARLALLGSYAFMCCSKEIES